MNVVLNVAEKNVTEKNLPDQLVGNIRRLMRKEGITEAELSRRTNLPQATVHKILSGKTADPRASTLKTLSDFFGISIDGLLTGNYQLMSLETPVQSIPVISWKDCIDHKTTIQKLTPSNWAQWVVSEFLGNQVYALATKPSMAPRFPIGTVLYIDPSVTPSDGDQVVVFYPGCDEATLRELSSDGPTKLLLPINQNCTATPIDKNISMLGVVIKSSFNYA